MEATKLLTADLLDIIFDGRNKEYGAYQLRRSYEQNVLKALFIAVFFFLLAFLTPYFYQKMISSLINKKESVITVEMANAPVFEEKKIIPLPQKANEPKESKPPKRTVTYLAPQIADDNVEESKMPTEEELAKNDISTKTSGPSDLIEIPTEDNGDKNTFAPIETEKPDKDVIMEISAVEKPAEFQGGNVALMSWLSQNIKYPQLSKEAGIAGRVVLKFIVEKDGSVSSIRVLKGVNDELDNESQRVVKSMPKWLPGKQGGNAVRCYFTLPINFKLE